MAKLTGGAQIFAGDTVTVDGSATIALGSVAREVSNGNQWVYLQGTASTVTGVWVSIDNTYGTKLVDADDYGQVGIAGTAILANQYGWYQIYGKSTVAAVKDSVTAGSAVVLTSTSGYVSDKYVLGDTVVGAIPMVTSSGSTLTVWINYPYVANSIAA